MARTISITAPVTGSVWLHSVGVGQQVSNGSPILIMESMKMEVPVDAPEDGVITFLADPGTIVQEGEEVAKLEVTND